MSSRLAYNGFLVVIVILHIRDLLFLLLLSKVARFIHRPYIADLRLLPIAICNGITATSSPEPSIISIPCRCALTTIPSQHISHDLILMACISGKVIIQSPMTRHTASDEKLLPRW